VVSICFVTDCSSELILFDNLLKVKLFALSPIFLIISLTFSAPSTSLLSKIWPTFPFCKSEISYDSCEISLRYAFILSASSEEKIKSSTPNEANLSLATSSIPNNYSYDFKKALEPEGVLNASPIFPFNVSAYPPILSKKRYISLNASDLTLTESYNIFLKLATCD